MATVAIGQFGLCLVALSLYSAKITTFLLHTHQKTTLNFRKHAKKHSHTTVGPLEVDITIHTYPRLSWANDFMFMLGKASRWLSFAEERGTKKPKKRNNKQSLAMIFIKNVYFCVM
ncbi:MAG: hypothetical protein SOZ05_08200 [Muribaculaceae bacterium]|nr:hypothetical protein [Muribaculaceae bacterium]